MSDLIERLRRESARASKDDGSECCFAPKWTCCDPALLTEAAALIYELREGWAAQSVRAEKAEAERDKWRDSAEAYRKDAEKLDRIETATIERFKPLLAKIADIRLWRDTYPDGPDLTVQAVNYPCPYGLTVDDVRLARAIVKPSGDLDRRSYQNRHPLMVPIDN